MRIGELSALRKKYVDTASEPAHVTVNSKTGRGRVPTMFSVPYVVQYINSVKNIKPNDDLWLTTGIWSNLGKIVTSD